MADEEEVWNHLIRRPDDMYASSCALQISQVLNLIKHDENARTHVCLLHADGSPRIKVCIESI